MSASPQAENLNKSSKASFLGFLIITAWILRSAMRHVSNDFNFKWGLQTFLVAQAYSYHILVKAYNYWQRTTTSTLVQNHRAETAGHLLNYIIHSLVFFIFGGYHNRQVELDYMNLGFDDTSGWLSTIGAANCRVGYWTKLLFPTFAIALWSREIGDTPWLSRKCILLMDRLMTRFGDGPTRAQLAA